MRASARLAVLVGALALCLGVPLDGGSAGAATAGSHSIRQDVSGDGSSPPSDTSGDSGPPGEAPDPEAPPDASDPSAGDGSSDTPDAGVDPSAGAPQTPVSPPAVPGVPVPTPGLPKPMPPKPPAHAISATVLHKGPLVPGRVAKLLPSGKAAAPRSAPREVKRLIWTANRLIGLPYRWGGGHLDFSDNSYDCSGAVSYALHAAGLLASPEDSSTLMRWGRAGPGSWVTVYTNRGHAFLIVAGLRLDTSSAGDPLGGSGPRWRPAPRPTDHFSVRRPASL